MAAVPFDPAEAVLFVDNRFVPASGTSAAVINPSTLLAVGRRAESDAADLDRVLAAAEAARPGWAGLDAKSRARHLHALAGRIEAADPEPVARLMVEEMGKPYAEAVGEIANVAPAFRYFAEMARDEGGRIAGTTEAGSFQFVTYHPYGISVHILPFNFPILLMAWTVAASLAAGNVAIVKPAEATTLSTLRFMGHFVGLPPGVVSCLPGGAAVGRTLVESERTHAVAFTGSVAGAKAVGAACGARLKPCVLEGGGSDPMIVSDKADLEVAIAGASMAAFHLSGQVCTSAERFLVHEAVHDRFVEGLARRAAALRVGDGLGPSEIGPLVSEAARAKVMRLVDDAVRQGARIVTGGRVPPGLATGWFYEPTVLTDVRPDMAIAEEEVFGPVAAICRVGSFDEALRLANATPFGLGASLFTRDLDEAMRAVAEIEAGLVWVNNPLIDNDALPFGGWKQSGLGRSLGRDGLNAFRRAKMGIIDGRAKIHEWWYPYRDNVFYRPA
jgi:acyl-CoA reductase-like NAD-dependent aldehyde dehydrogenase